MAAYYNEIEPYAVQWLRNLIAANVIAPGIVDDRSIRDVQPADLKGFTQCHFFADIGIWSGGSKGALAGPTNGLFGPLLAPASLLVTLAKEADLMMNAISGPTSGASPASVALTRSLASKLIARQAGHGSILFRLTWKEQVTPLRRVFFALRGSALRTSATGCIGWATPAKRDYRTPNHKTFQERGGKTKGEQLQNQVAHFIPGASLNGLPGTPGLGLLNPDHSRWLQGIPRTWGRYAPTEMP